MDLEKLRDAAARITYPFTTSIVAGQNGEEAEPIGSGVYAEAAGGPFLVTCHHVARGVDPPGSRWHMAGSHGEYHNVGRNILGSSSLDLVRAPVVGTLLRNSGGKQALAASLRLPRTPPETGGWYLLLGYPATRSRVTAFEGDTLTNIAGAVPLLCQAVEVPDDCAPSDHFAIGYPTPEEVPGIPLPGGFSGSGVWRVELGENESVEQPTVRLAGIATRWAEHAKLLLVVRVEHVNDLLAQPPARGESRADEQ